MGEGGPLPRRKKERTQFSGFPPKLSRRKNIFEVREEKTYQKSVEEKITTKFEGGKSSRLSEEKNILDFTRKKILLVLRGEKTPRKNEGKKLPRVFVT